MKFLKNIATAAAVLGVATLAQSQSAQAFTIGSGDILNLNGGAGGVTFNAGAATLDFDAGTTNGPYGSAVVTSGSTGAFASFIGTDGQIADLGFADLLSGTKTGFVQLFKGTTNIADDVFFDLTEITDGGAIPTGSPLTVAYATFSGKFVNAVGAVLGDGAATVQFPTALANQFYNGGLKSSWSMTIIAKDAVPTPALIPGIAAMGMGVLRRKKAQQAAA